MLAFVITLLSSEYSTRVAERCIESASSVGGIKVARFRAVEAFEALTAMRQRKLKWTWPLDAPRFCPLSGLRMHPYPGQLEPRLGCAMSHRELWELCAALDEPIMILEHDAVFIRRFEPFEFKVACQLNDPAKATPRGNWWSGQMVARGTPGVHAKTRVVARHERSPDGLAGNSAYVIQPATARRLCRLQAELGVWPNDATLCEQLVPGLEELYPFLTRTEQEESTTSV